MTQINVENENINIPEFPDECPICHFFVKPQYVCSTKSNVDGQLEVNLAFKCTNSKCLKMFIAAYSRTPDTMQDIRDERTNEFEIYKVYPVNIIVPPLDQGISNISPTFSKIYKQSYIAEEHNLDEIAGAGYRKSLEFLIKDYCIYKINNGELKLNDSPDSNSENNKKDNLDEDIKKIKNMFLGNVINEYIEDANIKQCAEKAAWLGNDESHYVRKWEQHDIKDLKTLIELTVNWIKNELLTKKYMNEMVDRK